MTEIQRFFQREAEVKIRKWLNEDYIVALLGARQTGKTTLIQKIAREQGILSFYYSLDDVILRAKVASDFYFLQKDLEARLGTSLEKLDRQILLLIDEAQKESSIFDFLKLLYDRFPQKVKILISGSASFEIQKKAGESLAGRAQYVYLSPLSIGEMLRAKFNHPSSSLFQKLFEKDFNFDFLRAEQAKLYPNLHQLDILLAQILVFGLLPGTLARSSEEKFGYLRSVVSLYLEKDIRLLGLVKELENFQNLLEILSYQVGAVVNLHNLSSQIQISVNTLKNYRSILKNTFVLNSLFPYIKIPQKRLVKSAKIYFYDIGVANFLAGRSRVENVLDSKSSGGIFENIIIKSFEAFAKNEIFPIKTYFWRDYIGKEVDLIVEKGEEVLPVEITNSLMPQKKKMDNLIYFLDENKNSPFGLIIYKGDVKEEKLNKKRIFFIPWWLWY